MWWRPQAAWRLVVTGPLLISTVIKQRTPNDADFGLG
jgi:hypothetical protein